MAKYLDDTVLDAALNDIKNNVTEIYLCSQVPANYAEASSTYALANKTGLSAGSFTGPVNGDTSGRKLNKSAETGLSVTGDGTANHVALCTATVLKHATDFTGQVLTNGNTCDVAAYDVEFLDITQ